MAKSKTIRILNVRGVMARVKRDVAASMKVARALSMGDGQGDSAPFQLSCVDLERSSNAQEREAVL